MLIKAAEVLEHLPLFSEAFRAGKLEWSKLRALQGVVTPETEKVWLEYALSHNGTQIEQKVAMSPREWKRYRAFQASLNKDPMASVGEVEEVLSRDETFPRPGKVEGDKRRGCSLSEDETEASGDRDRSGVPEQGEMVQAAARPQGEADCGTGGSEGTGAEKNRAEGSGEEPAPETRESDGDGAAALDATKNAPQPATQKPAGDRAEPDLNVDGPPHLLVEFDWYGRSTPWLAKRASSAERATCRFTSITPRP